MNKTVYAAVGIALLAGLSGCASGVSPTGEPLADKPTSAPAAASEPSTTTVPTLTPTEDTTSAEDKFVASIRVIPGMADVDPQAAIAMGNAVCETLRAGVSPLDIVAISNTDAINNRDAIDVSTWTYCPEQTDPVTVVWQGSPL